MLIESSHQEKEGVADTVHSGNCLQLVLIVLKAHQLITMMQVSRSLNQAISLKPQVRDVIL